MTFERARQLADAVLLEGYVLYPYRASAPKNRYRWTFGVLAPRAWSEAGGCEWWWLESNVLVEPAGGVTVRGRLRFLQAERRTVEAADDAHGTGFRRVESVEVNGELLVNWEEGHVREVDFTHHVTPNTLEEIAVPFELPGTEDAEIKRDGSGAPRARVVRRCNPLRGVIHVHSETVTASRPLVRMRVRVENLTAWDDVKARRDDVMRASLISSHLLLKVDGGAFLSQQDPPTWARDVVRTCRSVRTHPVIIGPRGSFDMLLSAPIILYDHPQVAPESGGDLFDATEIDELLTLRVRTMTDDEKRHARATDARAAAIVDRVDAMPAQVLERMHGAVRDVADAEMVPRAEAVPTIPPGTRVRLRPGRYRTDAQDVLYAGCVATVEKVVRDVDGREMVAVTINDDPAAELHRWYGRFHYYGVDEVEVLPSAEEP